MSRDHGVLVACEGIDGSGKSTVAARLVDALAADGWRARLTREPTDTWLGEAVRRALAEDRNPWTDALLFMADHAAHVQRVHEWVAAGEVVVSDRWSASTFAYQGATLAGPDFDALAWLRDAERPFDRDPDAFVLLDLPVDAAVDRVVARGGARDKFEHHAFLTRVRENYHRLVAADPARWVTVDATRDADAVLADALAAVRARLPG